MPYDSFGIQQENTQPDFSMAYDSFGNSTLVPSGLSGKVYDPVTQSTNANSVPQLSSNQKGTIFATNVKIAMPMIGNVDGATITVDWEKGNTQMVILAGSRIVAWKNQSDGQVLYFLVVQDNAGSHTLTWPGTVQWPGGSAPTLTTTGNHADLLIFIRDKVNNFEYGYVISKNYTNCFLADTLIATPSGDVTIQSLKIGDKVLSLDGKEIRVLYLYEAQANDYYILKTESGETKVTGEHPYMMSDGTFKMVKELKKGDKLLTPNGIVEVISLVKVNERVTVYNLTVESPHIFVANGIFTHNKASP